MDILYTRVPRGAALAKSEVGSAEEDRPRDQTSLEVIEVPPCCNCASFVAGESASCLFPRCSRSSICSATETQEGFGVRGSGLRVRRSGFGVGVQFIVGIGCRLSQPANLLTALLLSRVEGLGLRVADEVLVKGQGLRVKGWGFRDEG